MLSAVLPFKKFLKFDVICIDNNIFRMHYKITVIILLISTFVVTYKEFFGDPIRCLSNSEHDKFEDAINTYCWIYGTYTLKSRLTGLEGRDISYVGIGARKRSPQPDSDDYIKHTYYQWVWVVLLLQAIMFYIPHYLWETWEGGRLKSLTENLVGVVVSCEKSGAQRDQIVSYFARNTDLRCHNLYALRFALCEALNLFNVVCQIFVLDLFLGGSFLNYGAAVTAFNHRHRLPVGNEDIVDVNPMDAFFPKLTKCMLRTYGASGTIQIIDKLCVLPLNIVNERIFVVLWFWFIILALLSTIAFCFRIIVLSTPSLRALMTIGHVGCVKRSHVMQVVRRFSFGDWFVLHLVGKNLSPNIYEELIIELATMFNEKSMDV